MKNNIIKLYLFNFFTGLHFISGVIIPFYTVWAGLNLTQTLILQSWFLLCTFLLEIPSGTFADYFGRKKTLALAALVNILGVIVYSSTPNFFVFMFGEFLWAAAIALMSGTEHALLYDTLKKIKSTKKSKVIFSRYQSIHLAGIMVGAPIGSFLASIAGLQSTMLYMAIPFGIALLISLTLEEPHFKKKIEEQNYLKILKGSLKHFYKHKILKILALDMVVIATISYFMIWFYQVMLKNAGLDIAYFGFVHSGLAISQIIIMNNFNKIERIFGSKRRLIFFSSLITGLMFILGGLTIFLPLVLIVIIVGGGFGLSREPLFTSYFNKYIPSDKRATVLSSITMLRRLSVAVINPVIGILADWSFSNTLILLGLVAVIFSFVSGTKEEMLID
ncbi:MAG: MFS transporter [Candidatus Aenigmarchaeota archaeon]|nr:MFS transporter [Candidatus Aenigmarchaeota archaeon]